MSKEMNTERKGGKYTVVIDLGESQIVAMAGHRSATGEIVVDAIAKRPTQGLKAGKIENIADINEALSGVIVDIESKLNVELRRAYGGIAGEFLRCERHTETILIDEPNSGVMQSDVVALHNLMRRVLAPESETIMSLFPENYMVDSRAEIKNPVGAFGRTLSATFNFTLCDKEPLKRLNLAFMHAGIDLKGCFPNSTMAAEAVLSPEEKEGGVAVVDLGEGLTNIAIYYRGTQRYTVSIPLGGGAINNDIASLMIKERNVEKIKCEHGCAIATLAEEGSIDVVGRTPRENKSIPIYNIAVAIEERVRDIIIFVQREIRDAGFENHLPYGLVLTGGGANLREIDELFKRETGREVRIATFAEEVNEEPSKSVESPEFATVMGLLRRGVEQDEKNTNLPCTIVISSEEEQSTQESDENSTPQGQTQESEEATTEPTTESTKAESTKEEEQKDREPIKKEATQTTLDLQDEEDEDEDEEDDEEDGESEKRGRSIFGFIKNVSEKVNNIFSTNGDTEM